MQHMYFSWTYFAYCYQSFPVPNNPTPGKQLEFTTQIHRIVQAGLFVGSLAVHQSPISSDSEYDL